jgi:flagellar motor switch protein FliG
VLVAAPPPPTVRRLATDVLVIGGGSAGAIAAIQAGRLGAKTIELINENVHVETVRDDIEALGPVKLRDVDEAQGAIVLLAKDLAAQGQIQMQDGREDEMVY